MGELPEPHFNPQILLRKRLFQTIGRMSLKSFTFVDFKRGESKIIVIEEVGKRPLTVYPISFGLHIEFTDGKIAEDKILINTFYRQDGKWTFTVLPADRPMTTHEDAGGHD